MSCDLKS